jgi:L-asparaginase II
MTVIAVSTRSGLIECEYHGSIVVRRASGAITYSVGEPQRVTYPRSANKLMQAATFVELGLQLPQRLLALAASSHSGEPFHRHGTLEILASSHRSADDLDNTPALPYDAQTAADVLRAGGEATRVAQSCSGKHAAMVATCVLRGWPVEGYLDRDHPLQEAITAAMQVAVGEPISHIGIDGCGAPAHAFSLIGLAKAYGDSRLGKSPASAVAESMLAHPEVVGGTRRDVTLLMRALPGVLIKDGVDGVMAAALSDGTGVALKVSDGAAAPRVAVLVSVLERLGLDVTAARTAVPLPILGHGRPVGDVHSTLP